MTDLRPAPRRRGLLAVAALAATAAVVLSACSSTSGTPVAGPTGSSSTGAATSTGASSSSATPTPTPSTPKPKPAKPVHVSLQLSDGSQVGVGMPIIAYLSRPITDATAFAKATTVTVNGRKVEGAWYFEYKSGLKGKPIEADYRLQKYWPGHARIHVALPLKGVSAGKGLAFDDSLTLDFTTGRSNVLTVDDSTHKLTVVSDGKVWGTFPVSLGARDTPTRRGTKVIMEKGASICMSGPGYNECGVKFTQRLTYDGEYLHAAPWNTYNIDHGVDSSNGCTNLHTEDAQKLFNFLEIGDVVQYPNANGPLMQLGDGYGDWNVPWAQWLGGGLYRTS